MNALFGSLKRAASVAASRAPLASMEASSSTTTSTFSRTTAVASRSFSASSSDDEAGKAFTASLFPGDGAFFLSGVASRSRLRSERDELERKSGEERRKRRELGMESVEKREREALKEGEGEP